MRTVLTSVLAGALLAPFTLAQRIEIKLDHLKAKAKEAVEVDLDGAALDMLTKNGLTAPALDMAAKSGGAGVPALDSAKIKQLVAGLKGVYVRNFEFDKPGQYAEDDLDSVLKQVRGNPAWSRLVSVKDKDERVEVHMMVKDGQALGFLVFVAEPKEFTVVNVVGSIALDQAKELVSSAIHYDLSKLIADAK